MREVLLCIVPVLSRIEEYFPLFNTFDTQVTASDFNIN